MIYWIKMCFSNFDKHVEALYEVIVTAIFSLMPFAITYFVRVARLNDGSQISLDDILGRGQLYLLCYGVFATIVWLAFLKGGERPRHSARALLGAVALVMTIPIIGFIGVDPTFESIMNPSVVGASYRFYAAFLFINYLLLFYMNIDPPTPEDVFKREASNMKRRYKGLGNA